MNHTKQWHGIGARMAVAGLLGGLLITTPMAKASATTVAEIDNIPTRIVVPTDPVLYPDPVCLGCTIVTKRAKPSSDADDAGGILKVTYQHDAAPIFVGEIVLTVFLLDTDERRT